MTFQVGLVGKDGIVLVSDRRIIEKYDSVWVSSETTKILINNELQIVYCFAGDTLAANTASLVNEALKESPSTKKTLSDCVEKAMNQRPKIEEVTGRLWGGHILLITTSDGPKLWKLDVRSYTELPERVSLETKKAWSGDALNPACFFIEKYLQPEMQVKDLTLLAAHTILMGGILNPSYVTGLDVVVYTPKNGFHLFDKGEIDGLVRASVDLNSKIAKNFNL